MSGFNLHKYKSAGIGNSRHLRDDLSTDQLDAAFMNPYSVKEKHPGRVNQNQQFDVSKDGPNDGGMDADLDSIKQDFEDARTGDLAGDPARQLSVGVPSSAAFLDSADVGAVNPAIGLAGETARRADPNNPDNKDVGKRLPNGQVGLPVQRPRNRMRASQSESRVKTFNLVQRIETIGPLERVWVLQTKKGCAT